MDTPRTDQALSAPALQTSPHATTQPTSPTRTEPLAGEACAVDHAAPHPPQRPRQRFRDLNLRVRRPHGGLWSNTSFMRLWIGESISAVGSQITSVALPLLAALTLDASPGQMGVLSALETLPVLLFGLLAGAWVDRLPRRPILIGANIARALVLGTIPLAWLMGWLRMELLFVVGFLSGAATLCFGVAYLSFVPSLVRTDQLIDANSRLEGSASTAQAAGPGAAGLLIAAVGAPIAIFIDSISYLWSAWWIARIDTEEPPRRVEQRSSVLQDVREGLSVVAKLPVLRTIALFGAVETFFGWVFLSVYVLYMIDDLHFGPTQIGLVLSLGGVGAILGSIISSPLRKAIGVGPTIVVGRLLFGVLGLLVPVAVLLPAVEVPLVVAAEFLQWMVLIVAIINELSVRQAVAPPAMLGRVNATMRTFVGGMTPLGALFGGWLGGMIGLQTTLVVGCVGMLTAGLIALASPLRTMRDLPEHGTYLVDDASGAGTIEP